MENLYRLIQARIKAKVSEILWIDMDEGQLEAFGENAPVEYPCALIGFPGVDYTNILGLQQCGEVNIKIRVAFRVYEKFNASVPTLLQTQSFAHFVVLKKLMNVLHGYKGGSQYSALIRISWQKEPSVDPKVYAINFTCMIKDTGIATAYEVIEAPIPEINAI
jgi:hypothetical protein